MLDVADDAHNLIPLRASFSNAIRFPIGLRSGRACGQRLVDDRDAWDFQGIASVNSRPLNSGMLIALKKPSGDDAELLLGGILRRKAGRPPI